MNRKLDDKAVRLVNSLHNSAMEHAANHRYDEAFELERRAAEIVANSNAEPSRSVIIRSAASLAVDCGNLKEVMRLARLGLQSGPAEIRVSQMKIQLALENIVIRQFLFTGVMNLFSARIKTAQQYRSSILLPTKRFVQTRKVKMPHFHVRPEMMLAKDLRSGCVIEFRGKEYGILASISNENDCIVNLVAVTDESDEKVTVLQLHKEFKVKLIECVEPFIIGVIQQTDEELATISQVRR